MLKIGPYEFQSRLLLGTGKYPNMEVQKQAVEVSGAEILTFAVRRMNIFAPNQPNFLENLDLTNISFFQIRRGRKRLRRRCESRGSPKRRDYVI